MSLWMKRYTNVYIPKKFLDFSKEEKSCLNKVKLSIHKDENDHQSCITHRMYFVATSKTWAS